ncbi:MAG: ribosome small subunit-dependent GTPase A [Ignavibacteria bacterium]
MGLEDFGYNESVEKLWADENIKDFDIGRVIAEHRKRYTVKTDKGEFDAEITGNMRFNANGREDYPSVGDWVAVSTFDSDSTVIHKILPRFSIIKRQAVAQYGGIQIIATNIDFAFLVQAVDRDFNINRLERYLTICNNSNVKPVIILSKIDLTDENGLNEILEIINTRIKNVPVFALSNKTKNGYEAISKFIEKGKTYCLLGSSGAGKSSLLNNLSGKSVMKTDSMSESTNKGRHVTSHRELIVLESGGILIDNPGMREVGITDTANGLEITFDKIYQLSENCRFTDCSHIHEKDCAVLEAVKSGELDKDTYENYLKMEKEKTYFESTISDRRNKDKGFGKMVKNYKKSKKKNNF